MQKRLQKCMEEGLIEGRTEGALTTLTDLVQKGLLEIKDAAEQAGLTVEEFRRKSTFT